MVTSFLQGLLRSSMLTSAAEAWSPCRSLKLSMFFLFFGLIAETSISYLRKTLNGTGEGSVWVRSSRFFGTINCPLPLSTFIDDIFLNVIFPVFNPVVITEASFTRWVSLTLSNKFSLGMKSTHSHSAIKVIHYISFQLTFKVKFLVRAHILDLAN